MSTDEKVTADLLAALEHLTRQTIRVRDNAFDYDWKQAILDPAIDRAFAAIASAKFSECHICGKPKGQPPDRCNGHYDGTASDWRNYPPKS